MRSLGDSGKVFLVWSLHEDLEDALCQRCLYESSCEMLLSLVLVKRSCKIPYRMPFYEDLVRFSLRSWCEDLLAKRYF